MLYVSPHAMRVALVPFARSTQAAQSQRCLTQNPVRYMTSTQVPRTCMGAHLVAAGAIESLISGCFTRSALSGQGPDKRVNSFSDQFQKRPEMNQEQKKALCAKCTF